MAAIVDSLVIGAPVGVFAVIAALVGAAGSSGGAGHQELSDDAVGFGMICGLFAGLGIGLGIELVLQLQTGRSVGKWLLGIRVLRSNGDPVELWRLILLRNFLPQAISQACGLVGLVDALMIFGAEQRCLHDHFADTIVVSDPRT